MAQEIEAKYRLEDPAALRERLATCGAKRSAHVLETNRIFDTADGRLRSSDCGLRLRTCRSLGDKQQLYATLTYKGPRAAGEMKIREEVETVVLNPSASMTILQHLGFSEVVLYEKRRETWQLDACEVCLDELPQLGWFVEIEGPGVEAVKAVAGRLAPEIKSALPETYVEMVTKQAETNAKDCAQLRFKP